MAKDKDKKNKKFISVIILSSGASQRFGICKYVEPINGIPLIYWSLKPFIELYQKYNIAITIVAGPYYNTIFELLSNKKEPFFNNTIKLEVESTIFKNKIEKDKIDRKFNEKKDKIIDIFICKNEDYENGMFSSYKKGIYSIYNIFGNKKNFTKLNRAIIISLADMPLISSTIVLKVIDKLDSKFVDYAVPYFIDVNKIQQDYSKKNPIKTGGKKGHPIALKPSFASKILKFDDKVILRDALKIGKYKLLKTEENGVLLDIDIKDDIKKVESILKQEPKSYGK